MQNLKCSICGKLASEDAHFYKTKNLCNRHALQLSTYGKIVDPSYKPVVKKIYWTLEEENLLKELYSQGKTYAEISKIINKSTSSIGDKAINLGLTKQFIKKNNINYKAEYQEYDWCYERYINKGLSMEEMAKEAGCKLRTIQKWCNEKHGLNSHTFKQYKKLNDLQRRIIIAGTLGDGHIDKREDQPMYIEVHAEDEKEYLMWKYSILKDLCHQGLTYKKPQYYSFGDNKKHLCKASYRLNTRIINDLINIRNMKPIDKIASFDELQLSLLMLDDGSRQESYWELCVAEWDNDTVNMLLNVCNDKFFLRGHQKNDKRYILFDAISSKKIDNIILNNIPNELDIIKKKITNNNKIKNTQDVFWIITDSGKKGLNNFCRNNKISYLKAKEFVNNLALNYPELTEKEFWKLWKTA